MTPDLEKRIYENVLRSVLWGAEREEVMRTLEVNGLAGEQTEELYRQARAERTGMLRAEAWRKAFQGLLLLIGAGVLYGIFGYGLQVIPRNIFIICGGIWLWGGWYLADGLVALLLAPSKKGPVNPE